MGCSSLTLQTAARASEVGRLTQCPKPLTPSLGILLVESIGEPLTLLLFSWFYGVGNRGRNTSANGGLSPFFLLKPSATSSQSSQLGFEAPPPPTPVPSVSHPPRRPPPSALLDASRGSPHIIQSSLPSPSLMVYAQSEPFPLLLFLQTSLSTVCNITSYSPPLGSLP